MAGKNISKTIALDGSGWPAAAKWRLAAGGRRVGAGGRGPTAPDGAGFERLLDSDMSSGLSLKGVVRDRVIAPRLGDFEDLAATQRIDAEVDGETLEALEAYEGAVELDPNHPNALFRLGALNVQFGLTEDARDFFHRALDADPDHTAAAAMYE